MSCIFLPRAIASSTNSELRAAVAIANITSLTAQELKRIRDTRGSSALAALSSAKCSNEDNYVFMRMVRAGRRVAEGMAEQRFHKGDHVSWSAHGSRAYGVVQETITDSRRP